MYPKTPANIAAMMEEPEPYSGKSTIIGKIDKITPNNLTISQRAPIDMTSRTYPLSAIKSVVVGRDGQPITPGDRYDLKEGQRVEVRATSGGIRIRILGDDAYYGVGWPGDPNNRADVNLWDRRTQG